MIFNLFHKSTKPSTIINTHYKKQKAPILLGASAIFIK